MKLEAKMPKRVAVRAGKVDTARGPASGYVVFKEESSVLHALALNMSEVKRQILRIQ